MTTKTLVIGYARAQAPAQYQGDEYQFRSISRMAASTVKEIERAAREMFPKVIIVAHRNDEEAATRYKNDFRDHPARTRRDTWVGERFEVQWEVILELID